MEEEDEVVDDDNCGWGNEEDDGLTVEVEEAITESDKDLFGCSGTCSFLVALGTASGLVEEGRTGSNFGLLFSSTVDESDSLPALGEDGRFTAQLPRGALFVEGITGGGNWTPCNGKSLKSFKHVSAVTLPSVLLSSSGTRGT